MERVKSSSDQEKMMQYKSKGTQFLLSLHFIDEDVEYHGFVVEPKSLR